MSLLCFECVPTLEYLLLTTTEGRMRYLTVFNIVVLVTFISSRKKCFLSLLFYLFVFSYKIKKICKSVFITDFYSTIMATCIFQLFCFSHYSKRTFTQTFTDSLSFLPQLSNWRKFHNLWMIHDFPLLSTFIIWICAMKALFKRAIIYIFPYLKVHSLSSKFNLKCFTLI